MELPGYLILIVYGIGVLIYVLLGLLDSYHLIRFESFGRKGKTYAIFFWLVMLGFIGIALLMVAHFNWFDTFDPTRYGQTGF